MVEGTGPRLEPGPSLLLLLPRCLGMRSWSWAVLWAQLPGQTRGWSRSSRWLSYDPEGIFS